MSTGLGRVILFAVVTAVVSLLVTESYQSTPWLAGRVMQWSARLRYVDNPERTQVRGEELIALLEDLPTLFTLPTAAAFLLRALAYRLAHRRRHAKRESRAAQRSLGVRFRVVLIKSVLVVVCVGAVFEIEFSLAVRLIHGPAYWLYAPLASRPILLFGFISGILASIESVIRPSRFPCGPLGGIMCALSLSIFYTTSFYGSREAILVGIFCGATFAVATMITCSLMRNLKHVGVAIGILVNIVGATLYDFAVSSKTSWLFGVSEIGRVRIFDIVWSGWEPLVVYGGFGLSAGVLAGFAVARIRMSDFTSAALAGSLSRAGALNPESPVPIGEPPRQE